jgi:hypothetical protein
MMEVDAEIFAEVLNQHSIEKLPDGMTPVAAAACPVLANVTALSVSPSIAPVTL